MIALGAVPLTGCPQGPNFKLNFAAPDYEQHALETCHVPTSVSHEAASMLMENAQQGVPTQRSYCDADALLQCEQMLELLHTACSELQPTSLPTARTVQLSFASIGYPIVRLDFLDPKSTYKTPNPRGVPNPLLPLQAAGSV